MEEVALEEEEMDEEERKSLPRARCCPRQRQVLVNTDENTDADI